MSDSGTESRGEMEKNCHGPIAIQSENCEDKIVQKFTFQVHQILKDLYKIPHNIIKKSKLPRGYEYHWSKKKDQEQK